MVYSGFEFIDHGCTTLQFLALNFNCYLIDHLCNLLNSSYNHMHYHQHCLQFCLTLYHQQIYCTVLVTTVWKVINKYNKKCGSQYTPLRYSTHYIGPFRVYLFYYSLIHICYKYFRSSLPSF